VSEGIFRKAAIDRAASPEQLDLLMQVTSPIGWLALLTMAGLLGLALLWSVLGSIPDLVESPGVLMRGERLSEIEAPMSGTLERLDVRPGALLSAGQVIAQVRRDQASLEDRSADAAALVRGEQLLVAKQHELETVRQQRASQEQLIRQGLAARNSIYEFDRSLNVVQAELNALERDAQALRSRQHATAEVTAATAGRVVQVLKSAGDRVREDEPILRLEPLLVAGQPQAFCGGQVHAVLFVPGHLAGKVRPGDPARVSPSDVKREEYGYIQGRVEWVASYAASSDDMREKLKNDQLVQSFGSLGPVYEARVCLERDAANERNGFKWSSGKGPAQPIQPGAPCGASLVVAERRPFTYVIPALRRSTGL
jgi:HlyD family secretion protein